MSGLESGALSNGPRKDHSSNRNSKQMPLNVHTLRMRKWGAPCDGFKHELIVVDGAVIIVSWCSWLFILLSCWWCDHRGSGLFLHRGFGAREVQLRMSVEEMVPYCSACIVGQFELTLAVWMCT